MWARFAECIAPGAPRDTFWPLVSLRSQAVQDAVMASIAAGGAKTPVAAVDASKA